MRNQLDIQFGVVRLGIALIGNERTIKGKPEHVFHVGIRESEDAPRIVEEIRAVGAECLEGPLQPLVAGLQTRGGVERHIDPPHRPQG